MGIWVLLFSFKILITDRTQRFWAMWWSEKFRWLLLRLAGIHCCVQSQFAPSRSNQTYKNTPVRGGLWPFILYKGTTYWFNNFGNTIFHGNASICIAVLFRKFWNLRDLLVPFSLSQFGSKSTQLEFLILPNIVSNLEEIEWRLRPKLSLKEIFRIHLL